LNFAKYVPAIRPSSPLGQQRLKSYLRTLELRRRCSSASQAAGDQAFVQSLRETLLLWGMGPRGFKIASLRILIDELSKILPALSSLEGLRIDDLGSEADQVAGSIWRILRQLEIVSRSGQRLCENIVTGTMTLHHLLPELVFPIDREYAQTFFAWADDDFENNPEECFVYAFREIAHLARKVHPQKYVGDGWNTCGSKVLDNAIAGFCLGNRLVSRKSY
jgi:hypothetical protein